jgi:hypothetical protein
VRRCKYEVDTSKDYIGLITLLFLEYELRLAPRINPGYLVAFRCSSERIEMVGERKAIAYCGCMLEGSRLAVSNAPTFS